MAIIAADGFKISKTNTPTREGERIATIADITNREKVPNPFVGMLIFVEDEQAHYTVLELGSDKIGGIEVPNVVVSKYKKVEVEDGSIQKKKLSSEVQKELKTLNEDIAQAKIAADKAAADIGADSTTLLQGGIDAGGSENSSSYFLRTGRYSTFKLVVNDGYTIGQLAQYDLGGNFVALYSDYTQPLESVEWTPTSVVATDKDYMWVAIVFKGNSPTVAIYPREDVVKTFVSGLHYYMQGGEGDPQSTAAQAKAIAQQVTATAIDNLPNEEDLTLGEDGKMQLANRNAEINDDKVSSLGYVVLRKNKSFAEQVTEANTIYEIRYNFDLQGGTVELQDNCTLKFNGGKLSNGTLTGTFTLIDGILNNILQNVILSGTYKNLTCNLEWWNVVRSAKVENSVDNYDAINCAFRSSIPIIEVNGRYGLSQPVLLPYNKIIRGRSGSNNQLTGFFANDDFAPKIVDFAARNNKEAFTQEVYGMFYHRDTTKLEIHDLFIDARYKSRYCIEHIDLYGSCDLYNTYIKDALLVGVLQYACEYPNFVDTYITGCHIGMICSSQMWGSTTTENIDGKSVIKTTSEQLNPLLTNVFNKNKGAANIVVTNGLRLLGNNYGCVFVGNSDLRLDNLETAYNAIAGAVIINAQVCEINKYYTEGDSQCNFYIKDGIRTDAESGTALPYLVENEIDGYSTGYSSIDCLSDSVSLRYRTPMYIFNSNVNLNTGFFSIKPRSEIVANPPTYIHPSDASVPGVDAMLFIAKQSHIKIGVIDDFILTDGMYHKFYAWILFEYDRDNGIAPEIFCDMRKAHSDFARPVVQSRISNGFQNEAELYYREKAPRIISSSHSRDLNSDIESARTRYNPLDAKKLDWRKGKFVKMHNGFPLYSGNLVQQPFRYSKEQWLEKFKNLKVIQVYGILEVLEDIQYQPAIKCTYYSDYYQTSAKAFSNNNIAIDMLIKKGIYEMVTYLPIETTFDYAYILLGWGTFKEYGADAITDKILFSDLYFYEIGSEFIPHQFNSVTLPSGKTEDRPDPSFAGQNYFDTTLGKNIWWNGTAWVDSAGVEV